MELRRRDFLLATGLTLVFGSGANARVLSDVEPFIFPARSIPRRLFLRNAHTGEVFSGPYRDHIGPIPEAMIDLALLLRDHRENTCGPVFVETMDFLADVVEAAGQTRATVLSGYRTKKTNAMLAARIFGVAEKSQHLAGRAVDITLDSNLSPAAKYARKMVRGGVGWYPRSHFIHLDSGPVRNWTIDATVGAKRGGKRGDRILHIFEPERVIAEGGAKRPLTVRERLKLQRALAQRQAKSGR